MPIFDFQCSKCFTIYEAIVSSPGDQPVCSVCLKNNTGIHWQDKLVSAAKLFKGLPFGNGKSSITSKK